MTLNLSRMLSNRLLGIALNILLGIFLFYSSFWLGGSIAVNEILDRNPTPISRSSPHDEEYYRWATDPRSIRWRLAEFVPYNPTARWNRNIIQSWHSEITTSDGFFESWERHNPKFNHVLYNDTTESETVLEISEYDLKEVNRTYSELLRKKLVLRSDFFRYLVVWADGGIWADVDTWAQRPFNEWISLAVDPNYPHESLASLESKVGMIVGLECLEGEGGQWDSLAQYVFAAKQGHPILLELIARIIENAGEMANRLDSDDDIMNREILGMTGPGIFTDIVSDWIKNRWDASFNLHRDWSNMPNARLFGDILVLPVWAFGSGLGYPNTFGWDDPRICAGHRFLGSWIAEGKW
jgi:mannosyltransferase OCH1-like enzyme